MRIELGMTANSCVEEKPSVKVVVDGMTIIENIILDTCGSVDDPAASLQTIIIDAPIDDDLPQEHILQVHAENILDGYKTLGDFGFQVRSIKLDGVDLEWFFKDSTTYNPIIDKNYIDHYLATNDRLHEIESIDGQKMHVVRGDYANYVNMPHGWFELKFQCPLYQWFLERNFGSLTRSLVMEFDEQGPRYLAETI